MVGERGTTTVPDAYRGKEASFIKHELLRAYLKRLFLIIGMSAAKLGITEFCYVDGFAGPWQDESEDLESTSIAISLNILNECQQDLRKQSRSVRIRALYIEKDDAAFNRLNRYLRGHTPAGIETKALSGDFVALRQDILHWCGSAAFVFFFLDPKGWSPVEVTALRPLLARPRSEFLINFMYDFISRAASMKDFQEHMIQLLGERVGVQHIHGKDREKRILDVYRKNLKSSMPTTSGWPARSAYVRVLDRQKERTKYHLVYLTSHPHGIVVFMEISEKLESVQKLVRASTKQISRVERTGQSEMFNIGDFPEPSEPSVDIAEVEQFWLGRLSNDATTFGEAAFADLLEETDWFPGDLQRALGNLIDAGKVLNLDAERRRRSRFLHFEKKNGERLRLSGDK